MKNFNCIFSCDHERHQPYHGKFTHANGDWYERTYYWHVAKYVMDTTCSPSDGDDLELFQDAVFESPWGRIHINFYEQLFKNYYQLDSRWTVEVFCRYCLYIDKISPLFTGDAFEFVFRKDDSKLILHLLKDMSFDIKMKFIKASEKHPKIIQSVPKLKMYNLFS